MIWGNSIEKYTLTYHKTDGQWEFDVWHSEPKAGALWQPRGMGWEGQWERGSLQETHVHLWLIHVDVWQKSSQYYTVTIFQLKNK